MAGLSAELTIEVDQSGVTGAGTFTVKIDFKADPPAFDMASLSVNTLFCNEGDSSWSLQLPPIVNVGDASSVTVKMEKGSHSDLFEYSPDSGLVILAASTIGADCPDTSDISLKFVLKHD